MADPAILTCALTGVLTNPHSTRCRSRRRRWRPRRATPSTPAPASCTCTCARRNPASATCRAGTRTWPQPCRRRDPRGLPGRDHQPDHRRRRQGHLRPGRLPPARAARDRRLQRRQPELPEDQGRRRVGLAADGLRQPGGQGRSRCWQVMDECGTHPEFECFDVGIVRSVGMYLKAGLFSGVPEVQLRDGRGQRHALRRRPAGAAAALDAPPAPSGRRTLIGRAEIWPVHQKTAELGGMLRTGLEDTFYLPDGERAARQRRADRGAGGRARGAPAATSRRRLAREHARPGPEARRSPCRQAMTTIAPASPRSAARARAAGRSADGPVRAAHHVQHGARTAGAVAAPGRRARPHRDAARTGRPLRATGGCTEE